MPGETYKVINNKEAMEFEIMLDDGERAYLTYRFYKNDIAFMHTFVPKDREGRGIAGTLARAAFHYAAELDKPVMVYCPYVAGFIKKHTEYRPQLDPEFHRH